MKNKDRINKEIKLLGYYQLIGGILGIAFLLYELVKIASQKSIDFGQIILLIILSLPFLFSIYAGNQCLKIKSNKLLISKTNQALQVISFSIGGFAFTYHSGIYFSLGFDLTNELIFKFNFGLSTMTFEWNTLSENSFVLVNLVAFYLVYRILQLENLLIDEENETSNLEIEEHLVSGE